jgi:hypothetical protein
MLLFRSLFSANKQLHLAWLVVISMTLSAGLLSSALAAPMTYATVGAYDENTQTNAVDSDAAANAGNATLVTAGQIIPLSTFTSNVLTAFNNDTGGVVDFGSSADVITFNALSAADKQNFFATYGTSHTQTLTVTLTTNTGTAPAFNLTATSDTSAATPISGTGYMGLSSGGNFGFTFDRPLSEVALTIVSRTSLRTINPFRIVLDDDTTFDFASETIDNSNGGDDTFFGAKAPVGRTIKAIRVSGGGAIRFDDFAFVVAPVPEPSSFALALVGIMSIGITSARKRAGKRE